MTATSAHGLPAHLDPMVGRREEVSLVRRLLQGAARLVTLTGTAGVGKSRLAAAIAESLVRSVAGVWYVDLRGRGGEVGSAIASELKVDPGEDPVRAVIAAIGDTDALLLLDDVDGAVDEASAVVDALLIACPGVRILVTSREPLTSSAQALVVVGPFAHRGLTTTSDAIRLFAHRAATGDARFTVDDGTLPQVALICEAARGVPLAIELAAAQLQFMDAETLARRIGNQLDALEPAASESRSLRAAVEDSWERCSALEREVWSDLSVLAPGWDLELGEAMAALSACDARAATVAVKQLVRRSVVHRRRVEGGVRYELLPAIREFGAEKLEHSRATEEHFLSCILVRLHDAEDDWFSGRQAEILRRLRGDIPNIRHAVKTAASHGDADTAIELTVTAWRQAWQIHGSADELGSWLRIALRAGTPSSYWAALGHALRALVHSQRGQPALAGREQEQAAAALAALREDGVAPERVREADAAVRSAAEGLEGDDGAAVLALTTLTAELGEDAYRFGRTGIPQRLAARLLAQGEREAGYAVGDGIIERALVVGDRFERSFVFMTRAAASAATGDYDAADENARGALVLKRGLGNPLGVAQALELLADVAREQADPSRGATLLGSAAARWDEAGAIQANYPPYFYDRETTERSLRFRMGDPSFEKAFAYGHDLGEDESIDFALRGVVEARTRSTVPVSSPLSPALTPRETQVASLVADGESNKAIAGRLFVSIRTVEAHVQNALVKLGLRSRTELALWYREQATAS